jgi:hypothetical protein
LRVRQPCTLTVNERFMLAVPMGHLRQQARVRGVAIQGSCTAAQLAVQRQSTTVAGLGQGSVLVI